MARWQRDPTARRRLAYLLVGAEVLALAACFYGIVSAYCFRGMLRLGVSREAANLATWIVSIAGTAAWAAAAVAVGLKYVAGRRWARVVLIVANGILIGLGLIWFVIHHARYGAARDNLAALLGLLLPMVTLFPLLWPLLRFRPVPPREQGGGP